MEKEFNLSSLTLALSWTASLFLFAGIQKIVGDALVYVIFNDRLNPPGLIEIILIFIISWITALFLFLLITRTLIRDYELRTSMTIGIVISSIVLPIITFAITPTILFGSVNFDIREDYVDILRNLSIGTVSLVVMFKWRRQQRV